MALSSTSFSSAYQPGQRGIKRREVTERLTRSFLIRHGLKLFNALLRCAEEHPDLEARARAADRLLKHLLLQPKSQEANPADQQVSVALLDFMKSLHGKIPLETLDLMLQSLKDLEATLTQETEQASDV